MLAASDVRIRSLRIAGSLVDRGGVVAALTQADWSLAESDAVLILRRIHVGGPLPRIAGLAVERARDMRRRAVSGWDTQAEQAEAVYFASRAEMLACLMRDVLRGRQLWFWRNWATLFTLPAGQAICRAIASDPLYWPTVLQALEQRNAATAVWLALQAADARQLLDTLARATGWKLDPQSAAVPQRLTPEPSASSTFSRAPMPEWLPRLVANHVGNIQDDTAVLQLACVTWLWQHAPQTLAGRQAARQIAQIVRAWRDQAGRDSARAASPLLEARTQQAASESSAADAHPGRLQSSDATRTSSPEPNAVLRGDVPSALRADTDPPGDSVPAPRENRVSPDELTPPAPQLDIQQHDDAATPAEPERLNPTPVDPARERSDARTPDVVVSQYPTTTSDVGLTAGELAPAGESRFMTRQGGWFLLLNVLALPAAQACIETRTARPPLADLAAGWIWLYRLGRALGGETDASLANFLAHAAGLPDSAALAALPALEPEAELARLAHARYGEVMRDTGLFAQPALAIATRSHLDLHYRMTDIRLDVRRVALDVDPGWLPWLGCVVRFHYGDVPELNGFEPI